MRLTYTEYRKTTRDLNPHITTFSADVLDVLPASAGMLGGAVGMYLGGPVSAFCIGTLMTGVIGYRVEQYKLGIERKEARDISDEKRANT